MRGRMLIAVGLTWLAAVLTVLLVTGIAMLRSGASGLGFVVDEGWGFVALSLIIAVVIVGWIIPLVAGLRERRREQQEERGA